MYSKRIYFFLILIVCSCLMTACQSVQKDVMKTVTADAQPTVEQVPQNNREVAVPDRDERTEDSQYLSQIDKLRKQVLEQGLELSKAKQEREAAITSRNMAQSRQEILASEIKEAGVVLRNAEQREKRLKTKLLEAQVEAVRAKQALNNMKIRTLINEATK